MHGADPGRPVAADDPAETSSVANFVLVYSGGSLPDSPAEQAQVMDAWMAWFGKLGDRVVDGGNPFKPTAKHLSSDKQVGDGPIGSGATGYSILRADTLDAAVDAAKGCPVLDGGGQITVYETLPMS